MASLGLEISDGKLKGKEWEIANGEKVLAFLGIPYGKAPVGELRYKAPHPAVPWKGVRDATKDGDPCYGGNLLTRQMEGSEDCLFVNVFTKSLKENHLSPVMVFIHGGAFVEGSNGSDIFSPDFLLLEDVVLVAINYRVGMAGFLSLDDPSLEIPGNAGLKDQVLALKWVQKNIAYFGGDPKNVTIFGESAGSASVHYHVLSKASKGLFHKAIMQSGTVLNPWPHGSAKLVDILAASGVQAKNEKSAYEHIKDMPVEQVYKFQETYIQHLKTSLGIFGPVVEKPNPTAFLTEDPESTIVSGNYNQVPMILGYCDKEAIIFLADIYKLMCGLPKEWNPTIEEQIAIYLGMDKETESFKNLMRKYENFYLKSGMNDGSVLLVSDVLFIDGIIACAKMHAAKSTAPVFLYRFALDTTLNLFKMMSNQLHIQGASHADDLGYLFRPQMPNVPIMKLAKGSAEELAVNRVVKMWTNFARCSDPTPPGSDIGITWKAMEKGVSNFLDINNTFAMGTEPEKERYPIWKDVGCLKIADRHFPSNL